MVTLYYTWDGRPAQSKEEADWVVYYRHARWDPWFQAFTTRRRDFVSVYISGFRENYSWWYVKAIRRWPTVLDLNSFIEMWLARERSADEFLRERPFKPMPLYGKPEGLEMEIMVADKRKNEWSSITLGADALAPLHGVLPYSKEYGCMVFDAWGRRPAVAPVCNAEIPGGGSDLLMLKGELPGAGWVVCWLRGGSVYLGSVAIIDFHVYLNLRGYGLVSVLSGRVLLQRELAGNMYDSMWAPDFNKVEADLLVRDVLATEETELKTT